MSLFVAWRFVPVLSYNCKGVDGGEEREMRREEERRGEERRGETNKRQKRRIKVKKSIRRERRIAKK